MTSAKTLSVENYQWLQPLWQRMCKQASEARLAHAYLLQGKAGLGGKAFALEFAKWLSCDRLREEASKNKGGRSDRIPCGSCLSCHQIEIGTYPDLLAIEPMGQFIKIDQIRSLTEANQLQAARGGYRIYIINQADQLNEPAANALLKFLEEPPRHTLIFLIAEHITQLLPTIISRCQRLVLPAPTAIEFKTYLQAASAHYDEANLQLLQSVSGNQPLLAKDLVLAEILAENKQFLGQWLRILLGRSAPLSLAVAKSFSPGKQLALMQTSVLDLVKLALGASRVHLFHQEIGESLEKVAPKLNLKALFDLLHELNEAKQLLSEQQNLNAQLILETLQITASTCHERK